MRPGGRATPDVARWSRHLRELTGARATVEMPATEARWPVRHRDAIAIVSCDGAELAEGAIDDALRLAGEARAALVAARGPFDDPHTALRRLGEAMEQTGFSASFCGWAQHPSRGADAEALAIWAPHAAPPPGPAPASFRATAILPAYNEADVIVPSVEALLAEGLEVHIIDNWSTDGTYELALNLADRKQVTVERFPGRPTGTYHWSSLLTRVEEVAAEREGWVLFESVDELRSSPWRGVSLRDGFNWVGQQGFNAVDFSVAVFHPVDDAFVPGTDFGAHFRWFEFPAAAARLPHIAAWDASAGRAEIASSGGHDARLPGRRVFPYRFLRRHYPIRSQLHGERKVLQERVPRWDPAERSRGWHAQYDDVSPATTFLRSPVGLSYYDDDDFFERYLTLRLLGAERPRPAVARTLLRRLSRA